MHLPNPSYSAKAAFTLVELAIVLTIIGLLVGGVLVGQSLIENAGINATMKQLEVYNAGTTTFRSRARALPGDLHTARAAALGLTARAGTAGQGDGNSLIQNGPNPAFHRGLGHETALFWRDLWDSDFIPNALASATDAPAANIATTALSQWIPSSKIRASSYYHVHTFQGRHYFYMGGFGAAPTDADGQLSIAPGLTSNDALHLDEKLDDRSGATGMIMAIDDIATYAIDTGTGGSGECLNADGSYNVDDADGRIIACTLTIRAAF